MKTNDLEHLTERLEEELTANLMTWDRRVAVLQLRVSVEILKTVERS